jgi:prophage maintenance system killer protein
MKNSRPGVAGSVSASSSRSVAPARGAVIQASFPDQPAAARRGTGARGGPAAEAFQPPRGFLRGAPPRPGTPLPPVLQRKMEALLGAELSDVRVHVGAEAQSLGARAFTIGTDVYFAPGQYQPTSPHGLPLIARQLVHVVQQRQARVHNPFGDGLAIVRSPALDAEARDVASRLAGPCPAPVAPGRPALPGATARPSRPAPVAQRRASAPHTASASGDLGPRALQPVVDNLRTPYKKFAAGRSAKRRGGPRRAQEAAARQREQQLLAQHRRQQAQRERAARALAEMLRLAPLRRFFDLAGRIFGIIDAMPWNTQAPLDYLSKNQLIEINKRLPREADDSPGQILNNSPLSAAATSLYQVVYGGARYPTLGAKVTGLARYIIREHAFQNGNKRTGTIAALAFLRKNRRNPSLGELEALTSRVSALAGADEDDVENLEEAIATWVDATFP